MLSIRSRAYPSRAHEKCSTLRQATGLVHKTLDLAVNAFQGKTL
jgi:hypothetical protein